MELIMSVEVRIRKLSSLKGHAIRCSVKFVVQLMCVSSAIVRATG